MQRRSEPDDRPRHGGVGDGSSVSEAWLTAAVREAAGEVPRKLLTEVASWPAPGGAGSTPN